MHRGRRLICQAAHIVTQTWSGRTGTSRTPSASTVAGRVSLRSLLPRAIHLVSMRVRRGSDGDLLKPAWGLPAPSCTTTPLQHQDTYHSHTFWLICGSMPSLIGNPLQVLLCHHDLAAALVSCAGLIKTFRCVTHPSHRITSWCHSVCAMQGDVRSWSGLEGHGRSAGTPKDRPQLGPQGHHGAYGHHPDHRHGHAVHV